MSEPEQPQRVPAGDATTDAERLARRVEELEGLVQVLRAQLQQREQALVELLHSRSWSVTRPLRWAGRTMRGHPRLMRMARRTLGWLRPARAGAPAVAPSGSFDEPAPDGRELARRARLRRDETYREWLRRYETPDSGTREGWIAHLERLADGPLISVVMPVYNPEPAWLQRAIDSVRVQLYPRWELCIADDASTDDRVWPLLQAAAAADERIRIVRRNENGHISAASNSALALAGGSYVALLDHDDLLAETALFWVADAIVREPQLQLIYSDEDKVDDDEQRHDPYFKCDWNVDLFYSQNLFSHLGVFSRELVQRVGGFREGFEGSQDYDLVLRCLERVRAEQIHHIPRVLYHWRVHAHSTAASVETKPYALHAAERALAEHHARLGVQATVETIACGYRTRYVLPDARPLVSVIVPTRNALPLLKRCVEGLLARTRWQPLELIVVDNGSDDPATLSYLNQLAGQPNVRVLRDARPFNFSALNNAAVRAARGEFVALVNNDIEVVDGDWLREMMSHALRPGVGAVGARLLYPDGRVQHAGVLLGLGNCERGVAGHPHNKVFDGNFGYFGRAALVQSFSAVTAACMVVRKALYEEVGGLDEVSLPVAFNDVDFCLRLLRSGRRNIFTPFATLLHHESATRGLEDTPEKAARFAREVEVMIDRWGELLVRDPAYSPNLTLLTDDFGLAWPPRITLRPEPLPSTA